MGDININEISWLKYSDGSMLEARELRAFANLARLSERVSKPTCGLNLLDLILSDLGIELRSPSRYHRHKAEVGTVNFQYPQNLRVSARNLLYKNDMAQYQHGFLRIRSINLLSN